MNNTPELILGDATQLLMDRKAMKEFKIVYNEHMRRHWNDEMSKLLLSGRDEIQYDLFEGNL